MIDITTKQFNIMAKLSESFVKRATALCEHLGEDFGIFPDSVIPSTATHYFTSYCFILSDSATDHFGYSLWIDSTYFYFTVDTYIFKCKRSLHHCLSIEEIVIFLYLVFCKHQTFNL